jgi:hypothetical protein
MGKKSESEKAAATPAAASKQAAKKAPKTVAAAASPEPVAPSSAPPAAKKPAKNTLKKTAPAKVAFTTDEIALKAYFIAEKRHKAGIAGSEHQDWLEAERQLLAESRKKPPVKKKA